jgi:hypothetical protein
VSEGTERTLEELLAAGEVQSALILPTDITPEEAALVRQAYEAGLEHGRHTGSEETGNLHPNAPPGLDRRAALFSSEELVDENKRLREALRKIDLLGVDVFTWAQAHNRPIGDGEWLALLRIARDALGESPD